jgi:predicted DNA-binding protein
MTAYVRPESEVCVQMPNLNLRLPADLLAQTTELAGHAGMKRSVYIRQAIDCFNRDTERRLLAEQFAADAAACRESSLIECRELEDAAFPLVDI